MEPNRLEDSSQIWPPEPRRCAASGSLRALCAHLGIQGWRRLSAAGPARAASPLLRGARTVPWASPAQVGCLHSGESGAARLCLSFTKKAVRILG